MVIHRVGALERCKRHPYDTLWAFAICVPVIIVVALGHFVHSGRMSLGGVFTLARRADSTGVHSSTSCEQAYEFSRWDTWAAVCYTQWRRRGGFTLTSRALREYRHNLHHGHVATIEAAR